MKMEVISSIKKYYVYALCYPDGTPFYIGRGKGNRINEHEKEKIIYSNKHKFYIIQKLQKSDQKMLKLILWETDSFEESCEKEQENILKYGRQDKGTGILTNLTDGGEGTKNVSEYHRNRLIESNKTRIVTEATKNKIRISLLGRKLSEETKKKIGESLKRGITKEYRDNLSARFKGRIFTKEHLEKISKSLTGRIFSDAHRKNMSKSHIGKTAWNKGLPITDEVKKKISKNNKGKFMGKENPFYGKHHTEETKLKIRETRKRKILEKLETKN